MANKGLETSAFSPLVELRTTPSFYWIISGIFVPTIILVIYDAIAKDPDFWVPTCIMGVMLAAVIFLFVSTKLVLTRDTLHYRSFLVRVDLAVADIMKVRSERGFIAFSYKPFQRIVVTVRDETGGSKEITLNGGLFDVREIKRWVGTLNSRLS